MLIYLGFCFFLCFPIMVSEIAIGRKAQKNPVGAFAVLGFPKWKFLGMLGVVCGVLILSFYNVVAGWAFGYFVEMLLGNFAIGEQFGEYVKDVVKVGSYGIIFMLATAFIVSKGISGGIEKASKILMPALLTMVLLLMGYALTLPHAFEGVKFYLVPDFSEINFEVVYSAMGQAFFSLSLGMGAHITYGSYVSRNVNIISSAALITLTDVFVAFFAGMMMFPLVGYMSQGNLEGVTGGPGLIFATLPGVFASFGGVLGTVVGATFFLLLSFAALTSTVSLLEVPVAYAVDELNIQRKKAVWLIALLIFVIGVPSLMANGYSTFFTQFITYLGNDTPTDFMTLVSDIANDSLLPLGGCLIAIFGAYVWKKANLNAEISEGNPGYTGSFVEKFINVMISYFCPLVLGFIFILTVLDRFLGISLF